MELNKQPVLENESSADLKKIRKSYSRAELNHAIYSLIALVLTIIASIVIQMVRGDEQMSIVMQAMISFVIMYGVSFPVFLLLSKRLPATPPENHSLSFGKILLLFFVSIGMMIVGNFIGILLNAVMLSLFHISTQDTTLQELVFSSQGILISLVAVLCAPIIEEILYRKILIDRTRRFGEKTAIILSGVMFGLFHGNFTQFFYAMFLGMLFACVYMRTGKIIYTIILHMMVNFWGSFMPLLTLRGIDSSLMDSLMNGDTAQLIQLIPQHISELIPFLFCNVFLTYAMGIVGIVLLFAYFLKRMRIEPASEPVPKGKRFSVAYINLGFLCFLIVTGVQFVLSISGATNAA